MLLSTNAAKIVDVDGGGGVKFREEWPTRPPIVLAFQLSRFQIIPLVLMTFGASPGSPASPARPADDM